MIKLDDSNREEALRYVINLYTKFLGEPDGDEGEQLRAVHLKQMRKFTKLFNRKDEAYLVHEGLRRQSNDTEELEKSLKLRNKNTILLNNGLRTKASQVVTLDFPETFNPKKAEEPESTTDDDKDTGFNCDDDDDDDGDDDEDDEDDEDDDEEESTLSTTSKTSSISAGAISEKLLNDEQIIENIKKIKDIKDELLYPTVESLIIRNNIQLGISLQEKLEYLGFEGDSELKISDTTNVDILIKDILNLFMSIDLTNSKDFKYLEFVIKKIPLFKEWNEFIPKIKF